MMFRISSGHISRAIVVVTGLMLAAPGLSQTTKLMPGAFYDVGGHRLYMYCTGSGEPTVIFDAGLGGFSLEWLAIQRELEDEVRSCAYDRAGYGFSEIGPGPRTTSQIVDEFEYLLNAVKLAPPYILVGHSFGGYNMQYFAKQHPEDVAALVLVDASHPEQFQRLSDAPLQRQRTGKPRMVTMLANTDIIKQYPQDVQHLILGLLGSRKALYTRENERANFNFSADEVTTAGKLPILPLTVISRGKRVWPEDPLGDARETQWREMQAELALMSPLGQQIIAEHSGHMVHLDEPYVIAQAIRAILAEQKTPQIKLESSTLTTLRE